MRGGNFVVHLDGLGGTPEFLGTPVAHHWSKYNNLFDIFKTIIEHDFACTSTFTEVNYPASSETNFSFQKRH
jgi:hypothetical protein